ncbi:MAG: hypothetical protein LQ350_000338 [Teloschistes chrysophthalmus]|nr:MAG: hypothetical protein LQ350_000338 [Niorma chrysophthalma]
MAAGGLPPISYASIIVGFISFIVTFITFLRVFWSSLQTMYAAPRQAPQTLDNLRTELYGERAYFKNAIKQARSKRNPEREAPEITPLSILNDSIKNMMRDFRELEAPFLVQEEGANDLDIEKNGKVSLRGRYGRMGWRRRVVWLHTKDDFVTMANQVTRIQARRIAYETSNTLSTSVPALLYPWTYKMPGQDSGGVNAERLRRGARTHGSDDGDEEEGQDFTGTKGGESANRWVSDKLIKVCIAIVPAPLLVQRRAHADSRGEMGNETKEHRPHEVDLGC